MGNTIDEIKLCSNARDHYARYIDDAGDTRVGIIGMIDVCKNDKRPIKIYTDHGLAWFDSDNAQILTPVKYDGEYIGIGDTITYDDDEYVVYDYVWDDGEFKLYAVGDNDLDGDCHSFTSEEIHGVKHLIGEKKKEMTLEEVCKELGRDIKIVKR